MPIYVDTHQGAQLSTDLRQQVERRVKSGERDEFGVVDRGIIIDREGNKMHCLLEAPDVEAIRKHHEALDVPLEHSTIHEADVILKG